MEVISSLLSQNEWPLSKASSTKTGREKPAHGATSWLHACSYYAPGCHAIHRAPSTMDSTTTQSKRSALHVSVDLQGASLQTARGSSCLSSPLHTHRPASVCQAKALQASHIPTVPGLLLKALAEGRPQPIQGLAIAAVLVFSLTHAAPECFDCGLSYIGISACHHTCTEHTICLHVQKHNVLMHFASHGWPCHCELAGQNKVCLQLYPISCLSCRDHDVMIHSCSIH